MILGYDSAQKIVLFLCSQIAHKSETPMGGLADRIPQLATLGPAGAPPPASQAGRQRPLPPGAMGVAVRAGSSGGCDASWGSAGGRKWALLPTLCPNSPPPPPPPLPPVGYGRAKSESLI